MFRDTVRDLTTNGNRKLLLNLADVSYIDSSGIGEDGFRFYERHESGRTAEAPESDQACEGPAADNEVIYGF